MYYDKPIIGETDDFQLTFELNPKCSYKHLLLHLHASKEELEEITIQVYDKNTKEILETSTLTPEKSQGYYLYYVNYNIDQDSWHYIKLNEKESDESPQLLGTITPTKSFMTVGSMFKQKAKTVKRNVIPLDFVSMPRCLNMRVLKGNDLAIQDLNGFSDPYCKVYIAGQKMKTSVQYKNLNPVWDEQLDFKLHDKMDDSIRVEVWDHDVGRTHDFLGQFHLQLSTIELKKKYKIDLEKRPGKKDSHVKGNIEFIFDVDKEDSVMERKLNIFRTPILEVMKRRHETEAYPKQIKFIVDFLKVHAPDVFGIFRVSGDSNYRLKWSELMDNGEFVTFQAKDIEDLTHNVASVLKLYIRELPEPLLTFELYDDFLKMLNIEDSEEKLKTIAELFMKIPNECRILLRELLNLCDLVTKNKEKNLMSPENLAVVFGIGVLKTKDEMRNASDVQSIQKVYIELMHFHPHHFEMADKMLNRDEDD
jgi:hypothetical protein